MAKRNKRDSRVLESALERLREAGFTVAAWPESEGAALVSREGAAAVLEVGSEGRLRLRVEPGLLIQGELSRLVDRGYQKFFRAGQVELPATATQLHAIHIFGEQLKQTAGVADLFNEGLGTTSDLYQYDRLKNRDAAGPEPVRPWDSQGAH